MTAFLRIEEPRRPAAAKWALLALGFRPFYLLASLYGAVSIALWSLQFSGLMPVPFFRAAVWHAHEMVFGFTLAVIVGFLFTAGRNWTNKQTPTGPALAALAALWVAARVLVFTPYAWASAIANTAFPIAAAIALAVPFIAARNRRNYFFIALLVLLGAATFVVHLNELGPVALPAWAGIQLSLDVVLIVITVMAGRVIPMFTNNGVPGARAMRADAVERIALAATVALVAVDVLQLGAGAHAIVLLVAGVAHLVRWLLWAPWRTLRAPLVWVLHLAYPWIPLHLFLRVLAALGWVHPSPATHALTVGAVGGLVIGTMTRTAKGHTARPLRADRIDVAAYALVAAAAAMRVGLPLANSAWTVLAVEISGLLWSAGFFVYFCRYWTVLTRARLDGKPG